MRACGGGGGGCVSGVYGIDACVVLRACVRA